MPLTIPPPQSLPNLACRWHSKNCLIVILLEEKIASPPLQIITADSASPAFICCPQLLSSDIHDKIDKIMENENNAAQQVIDGTVASYIVHLITLYNGYILMHIMWKQYLIRLCIMTATEHTVVVIIQVFWSQLLFFELGFY